MRKIPSNVCLVKNRAGETNPNSGHQIDDADENENEDGTQTVTSSTTTTTTTTTTDERSIVITESTLPYAPTITESRIKSSKSTEFTTNPTTDLTPKIECDVENANRVNV